MQKGRNISQPADVEARRQWIYQNRDRLVHQALDGYRTGHRGALVVYPQHRGPNTGKIEVSYLSDCAAQASGRGWPDAKTAAMVRAYRPANEFVVVMLHRDGSVMSYRLQFSATTTHLVASA